MKELLLLKYAPEIFLKGLNRNTFEKKLKNNIDNALKGLDYEYVTDSGRTLLYSENFNEIIDRLKKVFGITEICIVTQVEADMDSIKAQAFKEVNDSFCSTFKIETNRANKKFVLNSMEVSRAVGEYVLNNVDGISVDIHNPKCVVNVEIREKAYVYSKRIKAQGGLPYGINGSTFLMLSGGIDSPVAGYLMARRGVDISCVYYHSHPYTSERAKEKVKELARILKEYTGHMKLCVVPFTDIQMQIMEKCREDELTIIMRRFMMRIACALAEKYGVNSVTTGESIGQVASQTMESLVVSDSVSDRPVFRPLVSMDKTDIMSLSRQIGTYETSILPYEDCCTIFVPKHPKTKPKLSDIEASEAALDIDNLVMQAMETTEIFFL
ncbi:putative tRNA sulfurtransferase [Oxobacter pfennigii]|uniref:Probable tRNA sulfurtransferase n=1 Tax=Oxobacter pfennigii TaxID=36849 RepID=A0A0P8WEK5_9CLOT|nr:tRNA uracil 4-sulfurtransferase ThiI [Oxobacter pfennigii]KPU46171.1 putative tRNA sulfurtransferase [Oxobacter pfennigii]